MKRIITAIVLTVAIMAFSGCGNNSKKASTDGQGGVATNVTVAVAEVTSIANRVTYIGEVKASDSVSVSAKVSATAKKVEVEIGDFVNEGDVLLIMDDTDYRTQYNQAQAAYNQALAQYNSITNGTAKQTTLQLESSLNAAKIEYNNAETNLNNQKVLYDAGAISKVAYDAAVTRFDNAKLNLNTAQSNYDITKDIVLAENASAAKATLDSVAVQVQGAQNALENTVIKAPISGYVTSRNTNEGQIVSPGIELFMIKATDSVDVQINVTESVISKLSVDDEVSVTVKSVSDDAFSGKVSNISTAKDVATGMYKVIVEVDGDNSVLKDGMIADVSLAIDETAEALVIPTEAVLEDDNGKKYVYIAKDSSAVRTDISTGITTDEYTEVISGIKEGDKVVVSGKEYISEKNNAIKIVK